MNTVNPIKTLVMTKHTIYADEGIEITPYKNPDDNNNLWFRIRADGDIVSEVNSRFVEEVEY